MKVNNLKVKKTMLALGLGLSIISLNKIDAEAICRNEIEITEENGDKEYFLFQKYERNSKSEDWVKTYNYYTVEIGTSLPVDSEFTKYVFLGNLDLENYNNLIYTTISNNYEDAAKGNFIDEDKISKECFENVEFVSFDESINQIVSDNGTVLGYTPKKLIYSYSENYIYR